MDRLSQDKTGLGERSSNLWLLMILETDETLDCVSCCDFYVNWRLCSLRDNRLVGNLSDTEYKN